MKKPNTVHAAILYKKVNNTIDGYVSRSDENDLSHHCRYVAIKKMLVALLAQDNELAEKDARTLNRDLGGTDPTLSLNEDGTVTVIEGDLEIMLWGCDCDEGHIQCGTVCRYCWAHGRLDPKEPPVVIKERNK